MAQRAADTASVLAEGAEDIEEWLGGPLAEEFHLLRHGKPWVLNSFNCLLYTSDAADETHEV